MAYLLAYLKKINQPQPAYLNNSHPYIVVPLTAYHANLHLHIYAICVLPISYSITVYLGNVFSYVNMAIVNM